MIRLNEIGVDDCTVGTKHFAGLNLGCRWNPFITAQDIVERLRLNEVFIYEVSRDDKVIGVVAFEKLQNTHGSDYLNIISLWLETGSYRYRKEILRIFESVAYELRCSCLMASGRVGWEKLAKASGYQCREMVVFWKVL